MATASINVQRSTGPTASLSAEIPDSQAIQIIDMIATLLGSTATKPEPIPEPKQGQEAEAQQGSPADA